MTTQEVKRKLATILSADGKKCSCFQSSQGEMWGRKGAEMNRKRTWLLLGMILNLLLGQGAWLGASAQTAEPVLRLEVGAHNAGIWAIAIDSSNRILVTGSEDKTVRVWDISGRGELLRILRPPVGAAEEGQIFAVALSPDAGTVACGGRTGSPQQGDGCVYLFDRATGALTRRLGGLPGGVSHLAYTADGHFLVATLARGGMRLYRLPDYALAAEDKDYGDISWWGESDPTGSRLATTCPDGFVRLYDLSGLMGQDGSSPRSIAPVSKIRPPGGQRPRGLAFSPDGTRLAVGQNFTPKVDVLEVRGNALEHAYSPDTTGVRGGAGTDLRTVAWSSDGRFLYAGGFYLIKGVYQIRKWTDGGRGRYSDVPMGVHLAFFQFLSLRAGGIAYCSLDGSFGLLNGRDEVTLLGPRAIPNYVGMGKGFLVSPDGTGIQFAYEFLDKSPALFSVSERRLIDASSSIWPGLKASFTWKAPISEGLGVTDWKNSLSPKLKGNPLPLPRKNDSAKSLAIKPDRSAFFLGTSNNLLLFDAEGKVLWEIKMPGAVWGVNTNGQLAVAALGDGTIRWYRVSDGKEFLALFPHPDRKRWVLWTPSGYYDASPGAEELIGWHVNNGSEKAADFFPISRFRTTYYRPDVVAKTLETLDEAEAIKLANKESGKNVQETSIAKRLPPVVSIVSPKDGSMVSDKEIEVKFKVLSPSGEPVTNVKVLVDGRPIGRGLAIKPAQTDQDVRTMKVTIPEKDTEVSIIAENKYSASEPATVSLKWSKKVKEDEFIIKPKLYILAIGVSKYDDKKLTLEFAAKDARDFAESFLKQKDGLYRDVVTKILTDEKATKDEIIDGFDWISKETTSKDIALIFLAGHGLNDSGGIYYYLPVNANLDRLRRTAVPFTEIKNTVASLAGKTILFIDTCHAGNVMGARALAADITSFVNELASAENGAVVFASSTGKQYSFENANWENGAFTKAVVEGVNGKADYTGKGKITINMLDLYVSERVKELTRGKQTPATAKPQTIPDFPLVLKK